jgi:uncharacterized protein (TIGR02300 family)
MSKLARGTKRVCPSCGARFYDLNRTPIVCPVCQYIYQMTPPPPPSRRWQRAQRVETKKVEEPIEEDQEIVDLGDDGAEIPARDDENALLEEEEEGEADVSGIVGADKN